MTAVGVANPRAQGHAITTTEMANMREKTKQLLFLDSHPGGYTPNDPQRNLEEIRRTL